MKKFGFSRFLLGAVLFLAVAIMPSVTVRAKGKFAITEVTGTSISFDWSELANEWLTQAKSEGKSASFSNFPVTITEYDYATSTSKEIRNISVKGTTFNCKVDGLKPGDRYKIDVKLDLNYSGGGGRGWSVWNEIHTLGSNKYSMKLLGSTDTSLYVDFSDAAEAIKQRVTDEGGTSYSVSGITYGYARQTGSLEQSISDARKMTVKIGATYNNRATCKRINGLQPNSAYAFSLLYTYNYTDKNGKYQTRQEYIEDGGFRTAAAGGYSDDIGDNTPGYQANTESDLTKIVPVVYMNALGSGGDNVKSVLTADETSITLDWSGVTSTITTAEDNKKITIGYAAESNYDVYSDYEKYGSRYNQGPYMRLAAQQAVNGQIVVQPGTTSYTITGLKPGTQYSIAMKCGYYKKGAKPENSVTCKNCLVTYKIRTKGTTIQASTDIRNNSQQGYMFDCTAKREAGTVVLDWRNARDAFLSQSICKKYFARTKSEGTMTVACLPLPAGNNRADIEKVYSQLNSSSPKNGEYKDMNVDLPATRARFFGLDISRKYVFVISYSYLYFEDGALRSGVVKFFADETGTNYLKKKATGMLDGNPGSGNDTGNSGGSGSGSEAGNGSGSGSGISAGNGSGSGSGSGAGNDSGSGSGNGSSSGSSSGSAGIGTGNGSGSGIGSAGIGTGNGSGSGSGSTVSGTGNGSGSGNKNSGSGNGSSSGKGSSGSGTSGSSVKKSDKNIAVIASDKNRVKISQLRKKDQKVTIKITGTKGKITVKDVSSRKLRKYATYKIKKRTVVVALKKGAPKGTYKIRVTTGAWGKYKKTTKTISIVVT